MSLQDYLELFCTDKYGFSCVLAVPRRKLVPPLSSAISIIPSALTLALHQALPSAW